MILTFVTKCQQDLKRLPSETDWKQLRAMSDEDIEANAQDDPNAIIIADEWLANVTLIAPKKKAVHIMFDEDVIAFFKKGGRGYQTRMNAVLRAYREAHQQP